MKANEVWGQKTLSPSAQRGKGKGEQERKKWLREGERTGEREEKWGEFAFAVQRLTDCKAFFSSLLSLQLFPFTVADLLPAAGPHLLSPLSSRFSQGNLE